MKKLSHLSLICGVLMLSAVALNLYDSFVLSDEIAATFTYPLLTRVDLFLGLPLFYFCAGALLAGCVAIRLAPPRPLRAALFLGLILAALYVVSAAALLFGAAGTEGLGRVAYSLQAHPAGRWLFFIVGILTGFGYGAGEDLPA